MSCYSRLRQALFHYEATNAKNKDESKVINETDVCKCCGSINDQVQFGPPFFKLDLVWLTLNKVKIFNKNFWF